ncbi:Sigma-54 dependent two component DNA-binding response regulator (Fis family protein) [Desulfosarcina cetonica]|uniref:sigma-54 interaction domain-containing protein n=1 Tax=Desulfosarcina cetonica TaxID=90730 RepID=UPI0006CF6987|nr:sigma-54 dependent transcriptional regulator [Desulfosarcina cetonica]VTR64103.1 Sigma-54 dependent two component DNA-binding response regulator (Fis family protein) [Desulfosarcina cetonica]
MNDPSKTKLGPPIVGVSKNIERVRELIEHVAGTGLNTVVFGESGVGKEVVAQNLYQKSPRVGKPFIKINCAALPEGLLESELFGYERGAFTGAEQKKKGKFQLAHSGVLLLDEIGDMSLPLQAKLLHVLQSGGEFSPLGSEKEVKADTWVIAATNHDLKRDIEAGKFREDLYYRLNIIKIYLAPLRERPEDIPPLINFYVKEYSQMLNNRNLEKPSPNVIERMCKYSWPGNVRELQNVLKRMLVLGDCSQILDELFNSEKITATQDGAADSSMSQHASLTEIIDLEGANSPDSQSFSLKTAKKKAVEMVEREIISHVLEKTDWNRSKASKILKISYKTLLYKISDLNIVPPEK